MTPIITTPSSGSITGKRAFSISVRPMSNGSSSIRSIRPSTSITRPIRSGVDTPPRITSTFMRSQNRSPQADAVLITGPANAKTELVKHIHQHEPGKMKAIAGVETVDHPSDGSLVAYARKYFSAFDRMQSQKA